MTESLTADEFKKLVCSMWTEKEFMAKVVTLAKACGWKVYHPFDSRRSAAGFPDLTMVRGSRLLFAELKKDGKTPTAKQKEWLEALGNAYAEAYCWEPYQWAEIEKLLE